MVSDISTKAEVYFVRPERERSKPVGCEKNYRN